MESEALQLLAPCSVGGLAPPKSNPSCATCGCLTLTRSHLTIKPLLPALTCSAQATYLTGALPSDHGSVGNGWYDRTLNEHHFWKQSNRLVGGAKVWEELAGRREGFRTANLFWWFNMYSSADFSITPRPLYRSDGLKTFDVHSDPLSIREEIKMVAQASTINQCSPLRLSKTSVP